MVRARYTPPTPAPRRPAGTPQSLRVANQRVLLDMLFASGPVSRAQLARDSGLSKPTVSDALDFLERAGLVRATGRRVEGAGRSALLYEADPTAGTVLAVDIGRDWIHAVVTDLNGDPVGSADLRNPARTASALVKAVTDGCSRALAEAGVQLSQVTHTVVGSPGVYDPATAQVAFAPNLPGWGRRGLAEALKSELGPHLVIDNDANLAALGELAYGVARSVSHFAFLMVGTGVGLGIVIDGKVYRGRRGTAGEAAFLPTSFDLDRPTPAALDASGKGLMEEAVAAEAVVGVARSLGLDRRVTAEEVYRLARGGDPAAQRAVEIEGHRLGYLVASIEAMLDPELIVFGGGIGQNLDLMEDAIHAQLATLTPMRPRLVTTGLQGEAVVLGAVATGLAAARDTLFEARTR
jgi:predicted NBD/HSP70 family sugar kinase